jgi:integrative and conjugative element protein (TIGR02256 family)
MTPIVQGEKLQLCSSDGRFGICLSSAHTAFFLDECADAAENETGGILIGHYTDNHTMAVVTEVTRAPADSIRGPRWFDRGIAGLSQKLRSSWHRTGTFYLGEWHYHPGGSPTPSSLDSVQMQKISSSRAYSCPEPILLIVGGLPQARSVAAYVYPRGTDRQVLSRCMEGAREGEHDG